MRRKLLSLAAVSLALAFAAVPASAVAAAPSTRAAASVSPLVTWPWSGNHAIFNTKSGRCLGIAADGNAGIWNCTYANDQEWSVASQLGTGYYLIESSTGCLYATGGQGAQVKAGLCNLTTSMGWRYSTDSHGRGVFTNEYYTGLILAVYSGETGNGSEVELYSDTNGADQAWTLS